MRGVLLAGAAVLALSTAAYAADMPSELAVPEAPAAAVAERDWSGFYLGIQGGYAFGDLDVDDLGGPDIVDDVNTDLGEFDVDNFVVGIYSGFNRQFGHFVLGIDNSVSYVDFDESFDTDDFDNGGDVDDNASTDITGLDVDMKYLITTRGRVGYAFDNFMVFAAGGVALAQVEVGYDYFGDDSDEDEHLATGWTAGGGVEAMFGDHWTGRLEYLYVDIEEEYATTGRGVRSFDADFNFQENIVRGGIAYKF